MQPDNIIIRRSGPMGTFPKGSIPHEQEPDEAPAPARSGRKATAQQLKIAPVPGSATPPPKPFKNHQQHMRILAILLFLFSALLFLALVSYTSRDEANAQLSMHEVNGLFRGDDIVRAKAETTQNWLGLVGAVVSNVLYNNTFGYAAMVLPFLIALWGKDLFLKFTVPHKQIRQTSVIIALAVLFSGIMGTAQIVTWMPEISREWSGAIGQFLSAILSGLIGTVGSFLVLLSGVVITLIVGTDIDMDKISARLQAELLKIKAYWNEARHNRAERKSAIAAGMAGSQDSVQEDSFKTAALKTEPQYEQTEEPARILKRSLERNPPPVAPIQQEFKQPEIQRVRETEPVKPNPVFKTPEPEFVKPNPVFKSEDPEVFGKIEETVVTAAPIAAAPLIAPPPVFFKTSDDHRHTRKRPFKK